MIRCRSGLENILKFKGKSVLTGRLKMSSSFWKMKRMRDGMCGRTYHFLPPTCQVHGQHIKCESGVNTLYLGTHERLISAMTPVASKLTDWYAADSGQFEVYARWRSEHWLDSFVAFEQNIVFNLISFYFFLFFCFFCWMQNALN